MPVQPPPTVSRFAVSLGGKAWTPAGTGVHVRAGRTGAPRSCSRARAHHPSTHTPESILPVASGPARSGCLAGPFRAIAGPFRADPPESPRHRSRRPPRAGFPPSSRGRARSSGGFPRPARAGPGGRIRPARPLPRISGSPGGHGRPGVPSHGPGTRERRRIAWRGGLGVGGVGGVAAHGVAHGWARMVRGWRMAWGGPSCPHRRARRRGAGTQGLGSAWGDMAGERSERRPFGCGRGGGRGALRGGRGWVGDGARRIGTPSGGSPPPCPEMAPFSCMYLSV